MTAEGRPMMKLLSLWQPWASAMAWGWKKHETRGRRTDYRGPVAIHATKQSPYDPRRYAVDALQEGGRPDLIPTLEGRVFPMGAIVAVGEIVGCQFVDSKRNFGDIEISPLERAWGNYEPLFRWIWVMKDVRAVVPYPCKGSQGMIDLPEEVQRRLIYLEKLKDLKLDDDDFEFRHGSTGIGHPTEM